MRTIPILSFAAFCFASSIAPAYASADPAAVCREGKAKAAGKKVSALLKAIGKNIKKPNPAKLSADVSKAQSKFTQAFSKAESKGGCQTTGDVGPLEAKADALVLDIGEELAPSTTTTTTTSTTTTTTPMQAACTAAGIALPTTLPDQTTCTDPTHDNTNGCEDWTVIGPLYAGPAHLAAPDPAPNATARARFYRWESGTTTCYYLYRFNTANASTLNGVHCYEPTDCKVCAFDWSGARPDEWSDLWPADGSKGAIQDCSTCHSSGPIAPKKAFWDGLLNGGKHKLCSVNNMPCNADSDCPATQACLEDLPITSTITCRCGEVGGPDWISAPASWNDQDMARHVDSPPAQGGADCPTCHYAGFAKDPKAGVGTNEFCTTVMSSTFANGGAMKEYGYNFVDAAECEQFAADMRCTPAQLNCPTTTTTTTTSTTTTTAP
jgi:hypothetical protein